ncbi:MAG TPA: protein kinase [Gaiellaceae bacterium]|nr:protein kinase [Gaiellaceae bacterium]
MKVGDLIADRYELEELVGSGGMASVYRAHDRVLERRVAIKVLHEHFSHDPEYVERFRREARAIARLAHPNVVTVIDRGDWEGCQFIVFEHVEGETLKSLVSREGPLPVRRALELAHQIGRALAFAHELEIVHRDVKPQNVLVDADGTAKVGDFGIARELDADDALTETGTLLGSGHYVSPEQASGERADEAGDQYSLGVVLYELLTGEVPYPGENVMSIAMRHVTDPVPSVRARRPEVPERVEAVVARALAKRPDERFPTMDAMVAALEVCLADEAARDPLVAEEDTGVLAAPRALPGRAARPARAAGRRRRLGLLAAVLAAAAVVAGSLVALEVVLGEGAPSLPGTGGDGGEEGGNGGVAVPLTALADFDPDGDDVEHPEAVPAATDGDQATFWTTETYEVFEKPGVGIVLDAGEAVPVSRLVVRSDEAPFTAVVMAGDEPEGPFEEVSDAEEVDRRSSFEVDLGGESRRYFLLWITALDGRAHVNEVRAFSAE